MNYKNNLLGLAAVALMVTGCDAPQPDVLQGKAKTTGYVAINSPRNADPLYSPVASQTMANQVFWG